MQFTAKLLKTASWTDELLAWYRGDYMTNPSTPTEMVRWIRGLHLSHSDTLLYRFISADPATLQVMGKSDNVYIKAGRRELQSWTPDKRSAQVFAMQFGNGKGVLLSSRIPGSDILATSDEIASSLRSQVPSPEELGIKLNSWDEPEDWDAYYKKLEQHSPTAISCYQLERLLSKTMSYQKEVLVWLDREVRVETHDLIGTTNPLSPTASIDKVVLVIQPDGRAVLEKSPSK